MPAARGLSIERGMQFNGTARRSPRVAVLAVHHVLSDGGCLLGGAEKYLRDTVSRLLDAGAHVHVNYSGDSIYEGLAELHEGKRLRLERTDWLDPDLGRDRRLRPATVAARMGWFLRARPDVAFVVQQQNGTAFAASVIGAVLAGIPVVMSIRQMPPVVDPVPPIAPRGGAIRSLMPSLGLWRRVPVWRMRTVVACCRTLIFNSHRVADQFVTRYGLHKARVRVIRNAEPLAERPRSAARLDAARFLHPDRAARTMIGAIAQLSHHKGPDLTLEAFARIAARFPSAHLIFFGDGPLAESLRCRAAEHDLSDRVTFAGYTADRETAFANIDLFVLPSRRESSSNAVAEAMARGLPCIVSDVGGLPELVRDDETGRVVPSEDPLALAEAMTQLLADPAAASAMGDAGYRRAGRWLDPATNGRATLETIMSAAGWGGGTADFGFRIAD